MGLRVPLKEILARELLSSGARYFIQLQLLHRPLPCRPAAPPPNGRPCLACPRFINLPQSARSPERCLFELLQQRHVCRGPPTGQSRPCSAPRAGALERSTV